MFDLGGLIKLMTFIIIVALLIFVRRFSSSKSDVSTLKYVCDCNWRVKDQTSQQISIYSNRPKTIQRMAF